MKGPSELTSEGQENAVPERNNEHPVPTVAANEPDPSNAENDQADLDLIMQAIESEMDSEENAASTSELPSHLILPNNSSDPKDGEIRVYEPSTSNAGGVPPPLVYVYHCENKTFLVVCKVI